MVPSMGITNNHIFLSNTDTSDNPLEKIIDKYKNHPSINCINKHIANSELSLAFQPVTKNQISSLIKLLNDKKAVQSTHIPTKLIKEFCDFFSEFIYKSINPCITEGNFIADFKVAEVPPLYKNDGRADKSNYRPISILSNVSKIYERYLYGQLYYNFDKNIFSKNQCGFRKGFSTQHVRLVMIEKMKIARDSKEFSAAILTDLSKAFNCICHDLLIEKLDAYGFDRNALKLIYDYLSDRPQKNKVGFWFSAYLDIIYGVPQGSILGALLFNIDLCDLFFEDYSSDFANFADDTTFYECGPTLNQVMNNVEITTEKMFEWFSFNNLKANASKYHLFFSPYHPVSVNIKGSIIESSSYEKLLGIYIEYIFVAKQIKNFMHCLGLQNTFPKIKSVKSVVQ